MSTSSGCQARLPHEGPEWLHFAEWYLDEGRYADALRAARKSAAICRTAHDVHGATNASRTVVRALYLQAEAQGQKPTEAEKFAEQELAYFQKCSDERGEAMMLLALAECNSDRRGSQRRERALEYMHKSVELLRKVGDERFEAVALMQLGKLHYKRQEADQMMQVTFAAMRIFNKMKDRQGQGMCLTTMSHGYMLKGLFSIALEKAERALPFIRYSGVRKLFDGQIEYIGQLVSLRDQAKEMPENSYIGSLHMFERTAREPSWAQQSTGRFDGTWTSADGNEVATIRGRHIVWKDAELISEMRMNGEAEFSCTMDRQTFTASLDSTVGQLVWSDGDIWTREKSAESPETQTSKQQIAEKADMKTGTMHLQTLLRAAGWNGEDSLLTEGGLPDVTIAELGLTSTQLAMVREFLCEAFEEQLPLTVFFDYPTVGKLANLLAGFSASGRPLSHVGQRGHRSSAFVADMFPDSSRRNMRQRICDEQLQYTSSAEGGFHKALEGDKPAERVPWTLSLSVDSVPIDELGEKGFVMPVDRDTGIDLQVIDAIATSSEDSHLVLATSHTEPYHGEKVQEIHLPVEE